jgi:UDP-N-acetylmuramate dehydrogenase
LSKDIRSLITGRIRGEVLANESLARHTSLKVGGVADFFVIPADLDDLRELLGALAATGTAYLVIGGGCNLLVRDGGFRGAVISLKGLCRLERLPGNFLAAEAGVTNGALVRFAEEKGLAGLEFLSGIPGTVGGALCMNAGAQGEALLELVETLTTLQGGEITVTRQGELDYGYRRLALASGEVIVAATFRMSEGSAREIEERIEAFLAHRRNAQRVGYPSAGSYFRNPKGMQAWRLIDEAGLRGHMVGGAQVAEAHTNFLINRGGATARDFLELARIVKEKVRERSGILLEEEVRIIGEDA